MAMQNAGIALSPCSESPSTRGVLRCTYLHLAQTGRKPEPLIDKECDMLLRLIQSMLHVKLQKCGSYLEKAQSASVVALGEGQLGVSDFVCRTLIRVIRLHAAARQDIAAC